MPVEMAATAPPRATLRIANTVNGARFTLPAHITLRLLCEATSNSQNVAYHPAAFFGKLPSASELGARICYRRP